MEGKSTVARPQAIGGAVGKFLISATDDAYHPMIHIGHALISIARYRAWRIEEAQPMQWLLDLVLPFFSHSMGGGVGTGMLIEGKSPLMLITLRDFMYYHFFSYLAVYWSPRDIVYRTLLRRGHPIRVFCTAMDALDGITTCIGRTDLCMKVHPNNRLMPVVSGVVLYNTGSIVKWLDQKARGKECKTFLAEPGSGVSRGVVLALAYYLFGRVLRRARYRNEALVAVCLFEAALEIAEDTLGFDAFERAHVPVQRFLSVLRDRCQLGPPVPVK